MLSGPAWISRSTPAAFPGNFDPQIATAGDAFAYASGKGRGGAIYMESGALTLNNTDDTYFTYNDATGTGVALAVADGDVYAHGDGFGAGGALFLGDPVAEMNLVAPDTGNLYFLSNTAYALGVGLAASFGPPGEMPVTGVGTSQALGGAVYHRGQGANILGTASDNRVIFNAKYTGAPNSAYATSVGIGVDLGGQDGIGNGYADSRSAGGAVYIRQAYDYSADTDALLQEVLLRRREHEGRLRHAVLRFGQDSDRAAAQRPMGLLRRQRDLLDGNGHRLRRGRRLR